MGKSTKLKFDRESNFSAAYFVIANKVIGDGYDKRQMGEIKYEKNGTVIMKKDGFNIIAEAVDEMEVTISPVDDFMSTFKFKIKKADGTIVTLPQKFFGVRATNVLINYDNEISGAEDENGD